MKPDDAIAALLTSQVEEEERDGHFEWVSNEVDKLRAIGGQRGNACAGDVQLDIACTVQMDRQLACETLYMILIRIARKSWAQANRAELGV